MSLTEITGLIIAIISGSGIIIQAILNVLTIIERIRKRRRERAVGQKENIVERLNQSLKKHPSRYILANLLLFAALAIIFFFGTHSGPFVWITEPGENQRISADVTIKGTCKHIDPSTQTLWVAVYDPQKSLYFIHSVPAEIFENNGSWDCPGVVAGEPGDHGKQFTIQIILANIDSKIYKQIIVTLHSVSYQGQNQLPDGVRRLAEINVTRK
jgi:hypothetical protein